MFRTTVLLSLLASLALATPPLITSKAHNFLIASRGAARTVNTFKPTTDLHRNLIRASVSQLPSDKRSIHPASTFPHLSTVSRPGLSGEACAELEECETPRICVEFDDDGNPLTCTGGDCICVPPDPTCSSTTGCPVGESCDLDSGFCFSNVVLSGETLDFEGCTSSAQCAPGRSCFGVSLTNGMLDCSATSCSCIEVSSTCATFQDCLVGTACTRISPEVPAAFCVANSFIAGSFGGGLTGADCVTDAECAGGRTCFAVTDDGDFTACGGATGCFCAGGGNNLFCSSSRFCDFGETCSDIGGTLLCLPVADVI